MGQHGAQQLHGFRSGVLKMPDIKLTNSSRNLMQNWNFEEEKIGENAYISPTFTVIKLG